MAKHNFTVANALSLSRIVFLPLLFILAYYDKRLEFTIAYAIIGSTDAFDGWVARTFKQKSNLGKALDSGADLLFYLASAWFLYVFYFNYLEPNLVLLYVVFGVLFLSFVVSTALFKKPVMMHTYILKLASILVYFLILASYFFDTTIFLTVVISTYILGFIEEILIFILYGHVDVDTRSILTVEADRKAGD